MMAWAVTVERGLGPVLRSWERLRGKPGMLSTELGEGTRLGGDPRTCGTVQQAHA